MKRKIGYYWVKWLKEWIVSFYSGTEWHIPGMSSFNRYSDSDFDKIDERRIEREKI